MSSRTDLSERSDHARSIPALHGPGALVARDGADFQARAVDACADGGAAEAGRLHGWTFASDGRLLAVSDREKFGEIDKSAHGLTALPCVVKSGMIFVVLTPGVPIDADAFYGPMLDDFAAAGLANWTFLGSRVIEGANWKVAFDGYLEGYHVSTLHPKTIHPRTPSNPTHYEAHGPHLR